MIFLLVILFLSLLPVGYAIEIHRINKGERERRRKADDTSE